MWESFVFSGLLKIFKLNNARRENLINKLKRSHEEALLCFKGHTIQKHWEPVIFITNMNLIWMRVD